MANQAGKRDRLVCSFRINKTNIVRLAGTAFFLCFRSGNFFAIVRVIL